MEDTVKQRLVRFIKYKGLSQRRFEERIDAGNGFVNNISKGIGANKLYKILCEFPDLNQSWLLTGEGEMLNGGESADMAQGKSGIPFYERAIMCGSPSDFDACIEANKADGRIMLPNLEGDFALVARGDSMIDSERPDRSIAPGSIVVLRKVSDRSLLRWGEIYAVATADGFVIKKVMPLDDDRIECRSFNAVEFPPFPLPKADIFGFARVIAVISCKLY